MRPVVSLALAACEKAVQLVYERELRPLERRHAPWTERVHGQMLADTGSGNVRATSVDGSLQDACDVTVGDSGTIIVIGH